MTRERFSASSNGVSVEVSWRSTEIPDPWSFGFSFGSFHLVTIPRVVIDDGVIPSVTVDIPELPPSDIGVSIPTATFERTTYSVPDSLESVGGFGFRLVVRIPLTTLDVFGNRITVWNPFGGGDVELDMGTDPGRFFSDFFLFVTEFEATVWAERGVSFPSFDYLIGDVTLPIRVGQTSVTTVPEGFVFGGFTEVIPPRFSFELLDRTVVETPELPVDFSFSEEVSIPDPFSVDVDLGFDEDVFLEFVLGLVFPGYVSLGASVSLSEWIVKQVIPPGVVSFLNDAEEALSGSQGGSVKEFLSDPVGWLGSHLLDAVEDNLSKPFLRRVKGLAEKALDILLDEETKDKVRESRRGR